MSTPVNLGDRSSQMRLQCKHCGWRPPEDATREAVQLHMQVDHDTDKVELDLVVPCRCGAAMTYVNSATARSVVTTDFFRCDADGSTAYVTRRA